MTAAALSDAHFFGTALIAWIAISCILALAIGKAAGRPAPRSGPLLDDVWDGYFAGHELPINTDGAAAEAVLVEAARIVESEARRG